MFSQARNNDMSTTFVDSSNESDQEDIGNQCFDVVLSTYMYVYQFLLEIILEPLLKLSFILHGTATTTWQTLGVVVLSSCRLCRQSPVLLWAL